MCVVLNCFREDNHVDELNLICIRYLVKSLLNILYILFQLNISRYFLKLTFLLNISCFIINILPNNENLNINIFLLFYCIGTHFHPCKIIRANLGKGTDTFIVLNTLLTFFKIYFFPRILMSLQNNVFLPFFNDLIFFNNYNMHF